FQRDLDVARGVPQLARAVDQGSDGFGRHQRGRAAAEEHRLDPAIRCLARGVLELGQQRPAPAGLLDAVAHMAIEVAVGALRFAEGPMHVDAKWHPLGRHLKHASTSLAKARPRWLIEFFSAVDISALVRSSPTGWKQGS